MLQFTIHLALMICPINKYISCIIMLKYRKQVVSE